MQLNLLVECIVGALLIYVHYYAGVVMPKQEYSRMPIMLILLVAKLGMQNYDIMKPGG